MFFEKNKDLDFCLKTANKLAVELEKLLAVCCENAYHAQKLLKQAYNKSIKSSSYTFGDKVWLNNK